MASAAESATKTHTRGNSRLWIRLIRRSEKNTVVTWRTLAATAPPPAAVAAESVGKSALEKTFSSWMVSSPRPMRFFILLPTARRITSVPTKGTGLNSLPPPAALKQSSATEQSKMADSTRITPARLSCTVTISSLQVRFHRPDRPSFSDVKLSSLSVSSRNSRALSGMASVRSWGICAALTGTMHHIRSSKTSIFRITASLAAAPTQHLKAE